LLGHSSKIGAGSEGPAIKYLILMFDEFQELPHLAMSEGFFQNLEESYTFEFFRGLTEEFRINLVIVGSLIGPIMDAIDVWHGRFKIFRLREFPREDSILMLRKHLIGNIEFVLEYCGYAGKNNDPKKEHDNV